MDKHFSAQNHVPNRLDKGNALTDINPDFPFEENGIGFPEILNEVGQVLKQGVEAGISTNLKTVLATHEKLKHLKATDIRFSNRY